MDFANKVVVITGASSGIGKQTAIEFAKLHTHIKQDIIDAINNSRESLLFDKGKAWRKINSIFDVTMGAYDGAEVCELVGLYLLNEIKREIPTLNFGLYRDDGLGIHKKQAKTHTERIKKKLHKLFNENGLKIIVETNAQQVNFLDTTLNLSSNTHRPYRKPNDSPLYINTQSNHPQHTLKQIPEMVQKRLSDLSSDENIFNEAKRDYQKALKSSGHTSNLNFNSDSNSNGNNNKRKSRKRNITYFNPPYNISVRLNIGKRFLSLLDKHFPKNHRLHKIINRNCVKLSYSCTPNMKNIISSHNQSLLNGSKQTNDIQCNCRVKADCPLHGKCLTEAIVYRATITTDNESADYIGSTETTFKTRFTNHKASFKHEQKAKQTTLAEHYWDLKNKNKAPAITWKIEEKSSPYACGSRKCHLCLTEKLHILMNKSNTPLLNSRNELLALCRHSTKFKLKSQ